jgi:(E)-4-hydroxy-3-methylbut-2-enyl-diphosphate synthase
MDQIERKLTASITVGNVVIGGGSPVVVQSMTNTKTTDVEATLEQISELKQSGCELIRVAIPDYEAAEALERIVVRSPLPVVADIHFDLKLAYRSLESGAAKIRVNPGNIGGKKKLIELAGRAEKFGVPIRVGVNAGSLDRKLLKKYGCVNASALVESALDYTGALESAGFGNLIVSLKASDVVTTISAYRLFSKQSTYPLHLGVTGAGPLEAGTIKGAVGIGTLLAEGIGDTLRVSLTASPVEEIRVARHILQTLKLRRFTPELISCPTCGRCEVDLVALARKVELILENYSLPISVAVMGCAVNGPGEAREADLGLTAGKKQGILFRRGKVIKTVEFKDLLGALKKELDYLESEPGFRPGGG